MKNKRAMSVQKIRRVILCVAVSLWIGGCTGGRTPVKHTVVIEDMKYHPAEITIHRGDTIEFVNQDIVDHDVTEKENRWASPVLKNGDVWQLIPDRPEDYYCSIHVIMEGSIQLEE